MKLQERLFIGGEWVEPSSSAKIEVVNPHSEEVIARVPEGREADIDRARQGERFSWSGLACVETGWHRL